MNAPNVIDAGSFNRQLSVENKIEIADGCGGFSRQFQAICTVWAKVSPASARRLERADNAVLQITHIVTLRFNKNIETGSRVVTGSRKFLVLSKRDLDETRRYMVCECQEQ